MGGVTYTGGCIVSNLDGGSADGGYTLRLHAGTHHLDGKQALALARTRENLCEPNETDIQREEHQQALFNDMKIAAALAVELLPAAADRLERAAGDHLRHERPNCSAMFGGAGDQRHAADARAEADRAITLPEGEEGLTVQKRRAARTSRVHGRLSAVSSWRRRASASFDCRPCRRFALLGVEP